MVSEVLLLYTLGTSLVVILARSFCTHDKPYGSLVKLVFFFYGLTALRGPRPRHFTTLHDHTDRHTALGRTPLDEWSARRRDLYLTTHNTHKRQTSMPPVEFEPTILVSERPQTHALYRTATGIGNATSTYKYSCFSVFTVPVFTYGMYFDSANQVP
jgi:hypothetical protein